MENNTCLEKQPLCEEMLEKMNAYWRAANYLSAGQLYLLDKSTLKETAEHGSDQKEDCRTLGNRAGSELRICALQPCHQAL